MELNWFTVKSVFVRGRIQAEQRRKEDRADHTETEVSRNISKPAAAFQELTLSNSCGFSSSGVTSALLLQLDAQSSGFRYMLDYIKTAFFLFSWSSDEQ